MKSLIQVVRGLAIAVLIISAPSMLRAGDAAVCPSASCPCEEDWNHEEAWACVSCAAYGEGCTEYWLHGWKCCYLADPSICYSDEVFRPGACEEQEM